ncbi:MAG: hypothetical protein ABR920_19160 [Terriglobales bacterium]
MQRRNFYRMLQHVLLCGFCVVQSARCTGQTGVPAPIHGVTADDTNGVGYVLGHPNVTNSAGGGSCWEFAIDMVPYDPSSGSFWSTINTASSNQKQNERMHDRER